MKISEMFSNKKVVYSFEIFPPKAWSDVSKIYTTLDALSGINPDYISITYSAGGSKNSHTKEIAEIVRNKYGIEPLAHLTCVNSSKEEVSAVLDGLEAAGVENVLALRGDRIEGEVRQDFAYASDLVGFIKAGEPRSTSAEPVIPKGTPKASVS